MSSKIKEPVIDRTGDVYDLNRTSPSGLNTFIECPYKWGCRYILLLSAPGFIWMTAGNAGHKAQEGNNNEKLKSGNYFNRKTLDDYVRECFEKQLEIDFEENGGILYLGETDHEKANETKEHEEFLRAGLREYLSEAKKLGPVRVEEPWKIEFKDKSYYITGITDNECIDLARSEAKTILDYKFRGRRYNKDDVARWRAGQGPPDLKMTLYQIAAKNRGWNPNQARLDVIPRTKDPSPQIADFVIPPSHEQWVLKHILEPYIEGPFGIRARLKMINEEPTPSSLVRLFPPRITYYAGQPGRFCGHGKCEYADICMKELSRL